MLNEQASGAFVGILKRSCTVAWTQAVQDETERVGGQHACFPSHMYRVALLAQDTPEYWAVYADINLDVDEASYDQISSLVIQACSCNQE